MVTKSQIRSGVLVISLSLLSSSAWAGGWTQEPGKFYLKLWNRTLVGTGVYVGDELRVIQSGLPRYQDHQINLYGEVGLHQRVTLVAMLTPVGYSKIAGQGTSYIGPLAFGARVGLLRGSVPIAVEFHYGFAPGVGDRILHQERYVGGDGVERTIQYQAAMQNHHGELQFQLGHGFSIRRTSAWMSTSLGVRLNSDFQHALTAFFQVGVQPGRFTIDLHMGLYEPFFQEITNTNILGVGNTRYLGLGFGVAFALTDYLGLTLGADGVFYASSNAATPSLLIGLEAKGP